MRAATPRTATAVGVALLALTLAAVPLAYLARQSGPTTWSSPIVIVFGAVGVVVARRLPRNPIGWTLLAVAATFLLSVDGGLYAVLDYRVHHGRLPLGALALMLQPGWSPAIVFMGLAV